MSNIFLLEIKRSFMNKNFLLAFVLGLFLISTGTFLFRTMNFADDTAYDAGLSIISSRVGVFAIFFLY